MDKQKGEPGSMEDLRLSSEAELSPADKGTPAVKETQLHELQIDATRVSDVKGSSSLDYTSLPHSQSPSGSPANNHLVYVRRKLETEAVKASSLDSGRFIPDHQSSLAEDPKSVTQIKELTSPLLSNLVDKPSTFGHGMSNSESALPETKVSHWEERFSHLQQVLQTLDQSDRKDYLQMLRSLSPSELSRHAVELEKRSMQLSLEEAKEMHRVGMLNVLGNSDS